MDLTVTMPLILIFVLCATGVVLGMVVPDRRNPLVLAWSGSLAALAAIWVSGFVLSSGGVFRYTLWTIRPVGALNLSLDRLSALFILVAAVVVLASSVFSASYMSRYAGRYSLRGFNAWYLILFASIVLVLISSNVLAFVVAWEMMSIATYVLVNFEYEHTETSYAGYLMLIMGELGFMTFLGAMLFLSVRAGSMEFSAFKAVGAHLGLSARWGVFLLTFFGFSVKAGLLPVNSWLPRAHSAAPANMSAILSGTVLNLGLYGIIRMNFDLVPVTMVGAGVVVLAVGTISALVGILYATTENDVKTMLAHSSIENIGIVTAGLGAAIIFMGYGRPVLAGIALIAALYHMVNHSAYKSLLFLGAGTVDDRAGTRNLDKLGGLIRTMPWTGAAFLAGALSISALPPFNGFVSEWLTLQTMLRSVELPSTSVKIVFALCGAGLALTAALSVTCFVKAFAMGFLGMSRSRQAEQAKDGQRSAVVPMVSLAALCLLLGVLPTYVIPVLDHEVRPLLGASAIDALVPPFYATSPAHHALPSAFADDFSSIGAQIGQSVLPGRGLIVMHRGGKANPVVFAMSTSYTLVTLTILLLVTYALVRLLTRKRQLKRQERWAGGIHRLLPEMTYTATGFSNPVRVIFDSVFRPTIEEDTRESVAEHFRSAIRRKRVSVYVMDRLLAEPVRIAVEWLSLRLAVIHNGRLNSYIAYVLLALLVALAIGALSR
jgi:hydrogenase-4 component B